MAGRGRVWATMSTFCRTPKVFQAALLSAGRAAFVSHVAILIIVVVVDSTKVPKITTSIDLDTGAGPLLKSRLFGRADLSRAVFMRVDRAMECGIDADKRSYFCRAKDVCLL